MLLRIDLQSGFLSDAVNIRINGREEFSKKNVTTKLLLGLADTLEVDISDSPAMIEVEIPTRNLLERFSLELSNPAYLALNIISGRIEIAPSKKAFGYF